MKKVILTTTIAAMLAAPAAFARHQGRDYGRDHRNDGYDYAEVVEARPIYREVRVAAPRQECWDERVPVARRHYSDPGATLVGALIGGVIGNQVGRNHGHRGGHNRGAATAAGAVIGASIGAHASARHDRYDDAYAYEQRCRTVSDYRYEQTVEGYDVTYRYHGRIYHTRTPYDPGRRIAVDVNVRPVR